MENVLDLSKNVYTMIEHEAINLFMAGGLPRCLPAFYKQCIDEHNSL